MLFQDQVVRQPGQPAATVQGRSTKAKKSPRRDSNPGFELRDLGCCPLRYEVLRWVTSTLAARSHSSLRSC
eukprot:2245605-Prymnesium_polylepis.1